MGKKLFVALMLVALTFMSVVNVDAMTEAQLRNKVGSSITIDGNTIAIPAAYLTQLDNYLDEFAVSSADCDYIAAQMDSLIATARAQHVTSAEDFYNKCSDEAKAVAANITANTGVKVTVLSNGKVQVNKYNSNEVWGVIDTKVITNTSSASFLYIAGAITALGAALLVFRVRNA